MRATLGICYYPEHWAEEQWRDNAHRIYATGIRWVRGGEFAWNTLEPRKGEFHWDWLTRTVSVLAEAGLKVIMSTLSATPPRWVALKYLDMLAIDARQREMGTRTLLMNYTTENIDFQNKTLLPASYRAI